MRLKEMCPSATFKVYVAGDYNTARQILNDYCSANGACFSIHPMDYIYTGGEEAGLCVTLINYPRFPKSEKELAELAEHIGWLLAGGLNQKSYSVEGPETTRWFSSRDD